MIVDDADEWFKWGWNGETGQATVWSVGGDADGLPVHREALKAAWGRPNDGARGDVIGIAFIEAGRVVTRAFYDGDVPQAVIEWFTSHFPTFAINCA